MNKKLLLGLILTALIPVKSISAQVENGEIQQDPEIKLFTNWNNFSLSDFEPIQEDGAIGEDLNDLVGWDISREWKAGDRIEDILKLGDLQNSLAPQLFSLQDIYERVNRKNGVVASDRNGDEYVDDVPSEVTLADFPLTGEQTIASLVEAVPDLFKREASSVAPIADLLEQNGYDDYLDSDLASLAEDKDIAELQLDSLNLESYSADSIPNLSNAQIEDMEGYEDMYVSEIPGLSELALSEYPNSVNAEISLVGRIDFVWGDAETNRSDTISGSKVEGFNVPCQSDCAYLELDDIENLGRKIATSFEGNQWIRGRDHWVAGGTGCLAGGREPTGIHPFGDTFKAVLWETFESSDTAQVVSFFNIKTNCGDSAYFIGPFPYPQGILKVNDWVFLGTGL